MEEIIKIQKILKDFIAKGRIDKAIEQFLELASQLKDEGLENELLTLSAKYHKNERQRRQNLISLDEYDRALSKIGNAVSYLVNNLDDRQANSNQNDAPLTEGEDWTSMLMRLGKAFLGNSNATNQQAVPPPQQTIPSLSGTWRGADGFNYFIQQNGSYLQVQGVNLMGFTILTGQGTVAGNQMQMRYQSFDGSSGTANLFLSPDYRNLSGQAFNFSTRLYYPISLFR